MEATALFEHNGVLFVLCPHCSEIHSCESDKTPRLISISAPCSTGDDDRFVKIGLTMKPKRIVSAMKLYDYEARRKQDQYRRRVGKTNPPAETA